MKSKHRRRSKNPRFLALEVLGAWQRLNPPGGTPGPFLDELLAAVLAKAPGLASRDQALCWELVTGVMRWRQRLDYVIGRVATTALPRLHPVVVDILRLTAYQLLLLERIPSHAAVAEAVNLAKARRLPPALVGFVNAVGRRLAAVGAQIALPDPQVNPIQGLAVGASLPDWLAAHWLQELGPAQAWRRGEAVNTKPPLTLRVNTSRTTPGQLQAILSQEGVAASPCRFSPVGLTLGELPGSPFALPSYRQGLWLLQDEAAQLVTLLLSARPGEAILEIGAGRGGKTTHLAQLLGGTGLLVALDHHRSRLQDLRGQLQRLQLTGVSILQADASQPLPLDHLRSFDRILIDAPCSGLGVLRRHPELKWRRQLEDIGRFAALQLQLLAQASRHLRPGGLLLYITCTTTCEENESVVQEFLATHPDFALRRRAEYPESPAQTFLDENGYFRTSPEEHGMDGFFAAGLQRLSGQTKDC